MSLKLEVGSYYWVEDPVETFLPAHLKGIKGDSVELDIYPNNNRVFRPTSHVKMPVLPPITSLSNLADDLVSSNDISEPNILWSLKNRFLSGKFYSSIGTIIIAINPYRYIQEMYSTQLMNIYIRYKILKYQTI